MLIRRIRGYYFFRMLILLRYTQRFCRDIGCPMSWSISCLRRHRASWRCRSWPCLRPAACVVSRLVAVRCRMRLTSETVWSNLSIALLTLPSACLAYLSAVAFASFAYLSAEAFASRASWSALADASDAADSASFLASLPLPGSSLLTLLESLAASAGSGDENVS